MKQRRRIYYSTEQRSEIWDQWQAGESMKSIGRRFDRASSSVFGDLASRRHSPGRVHEFDAWLEAKYLNKKARKDRWAWNFGIQQGLVGLGGDLGYEYVNDMTANAHTITEWAVEYIVGRITSQQVQQQ